MGCSISIQGAGVSVVPKLVFHLPTTRTQLLKIHFFFNLFLGGSGVELRSCLQGKHFIEQSISISPVGISFLEFYNANLGSTGKRDLYSVAAYNYCELGSWKRS